MASWHRPLVVLALAALAGCAVPQYGAPISNAPSATPPTCAGLDECELKWARALQWINANSHWRLSLVTDMQIETYPSVGNGNAFPAYRVTRFPLGEGRYRLDIEAACGNLFGCAPNAAAEAIRMNAFIEGGR